MEIKMLNKVELKEGTSVSTSGGEEVGRINRFVLDPTTNEITHIVVQKGWLFTEDKVVPFDRVRTVNEDNVILNEDIGDYDQLPPFEERHYIQVDQDSNAEAAGHEPAYAGAPVYYWYPAYGYPGYPTYGLGYPYLPPTVIQQNIPANTVPLQEGVDVISSDDEHVGDVERLLVDTDSNRATHFVISQGLLFKDRKLIPVSWINSVQEDKVHLTISSKMLERLPSYKD
jgi:uncharacterized protein YrrD